MPLPGYTSAFIPVEDLLRTREFVVGDDRQYGDYVNRLLEPQSLYTIYFVVASQLDGDTAYAFSQIADAVFTGITPPSTVLPSPTPLTTITTSPVPTTLPLTTTMAATTAGAVSSNDGSKNGDDDNTTTILAVVITIIVLLLILVLIIILIYCFCYKDKRGRCVLTCKLS